MIKIVIIKVFTKKQLDQLLDRSGMKWNKTKETNKESKEKALNKLEGVFTVQEFTLRFISRLR